MLSVTISPHPPVASNLTCGAGYEHVGNLEYHQIKSVLTQITDAHHLHTIEENSPQIKGEDAELWAKIIARDFPESKTKHHTPENYGEWWEVYVRYKEERVEEIKRDGEEIRQKMMDAQRKKETNVSKVVDLKYLPKVRYSFSTRTLLTNI